MGRSPTYGSASEFGPAFDALPLPAVVVDSNRRISASNLAFVDLYGGAFLGRRIDELDPGWISALDDVERIADSKPRQTVLTSQHGEAVPATVHRTALPPINRGNVLAVVVPVQAQHLRTAHRAETVEHLHGPIVHDLNNLLLVIVQAAEIAGIEAASQSTQDDLQTIVDAVGHAHRLTRRLSDLHRDQEEKEELVDLNQMVGDLEHLLRSLCGSAIQLEIELAPRPAQVQAVQVRVEQVLLNLVLNARDALNPGGTIRISTTSNPHVHLSVQDDGSGMSSETRARALEPYFTTKAAGKGTGLGLTPLRDLVLAREVQLDLYSKPGHGTTFDIQFLRSEGAGTVHPPIAADETGLELLSDDDLFGPPTKPDDNLSYDLDASFWDEDEGSTYRAVESLEVLFDENTPTDMWAGEHSSATGTGH